MNMIPVKFLCRQHLFEEHNSIHLVKGMLKKGSVLGKLKTHGLFDPSRAIPRHKELADEMMERGYTHNSILDKFPNDEKVEIDSFKNLKLLARCSGCRARMVEHGDHEIQVFLLEN